MFKNYIIFHILLQLVSSQSVSNALFSSCLYEATPSVKHNVLWLVSWISVWWLVNRFDRVWEMSHP